MSLKKSDIVLVLFPFTDLSDTKLRPAVILWVDNRGNDVIVCLISSQNVAHLTLEEFAIQPSDQEFVGTGLKIASKVRVSRIVTIELNLISRRIGQLGSHQTQQLETCLKETFQIE